MSGTRPLTRNPLIQWQRLVDDNLNSLEEGSSISAVNNSAPRYTSKSRLVSSKRSLARTTTELSVSETNRAALSLELRPEIGISENRKHVSEEDGDLFSDTSIKIPLTEKSRPHIRSPADQKSSPTSLNVISGQYEAAMQHRPVVACQTSIHPTLVSDTDAENQFMYQLPSASISNEENTVILKLNNFVRGNNVISSVEYADYSHSIISTNDGRLIGHDTTQMDVSDSRQRGLVKKNPSTLGHGKLVVIKTHDQSAFHTNLLSVMDTLSTQLVNVNVQRFFCILDFISPEHPMATNLMTVGFEERDKWENNRCSSRQKCTKLESHSNARLDKNCDQKFNVYASGNSLSNNLKYDVVESMELPLSNSKLEFTHAKLTNVDFGAGGDLTFQIQESKDMDNIRASVRKLFSGSQQEIFIRNSHPKGQYYGSDFERHFNKQESEGVIANKKQNCDIKVYCQNSRRFISCKLKSSRFLQRSKRFVESRTHSVSDQSYKTNGFEGEHYKHHNPSLPTLQTTASVNSTISCLDDIVRTEVADKNDQIIVQRSLDPPVLQNNKAVDSPVLSNNNVNVCFSEKETVVENLDQFSTLKIDKKSDVQKPEDFSEQSLPKSHIPCKEIISISNMQGGKNDLNTQTDKHIPYVSTNRERSLFESKLKADICVVEKDPYNLMFQKSDVKGPCDSKSKKTIKLDLTQHTMPKACHHNELDICSQYKKINTNVEQFPEHTTTIAFDNDCVKKEAPLNERENISMSFSYIDTNKTVIYHNDIDNTLGEANKKQTATDTSVQNLGHGKNVLFLPPDYREENPEIRIKGKEGISSKIIETDTKMVSYISGKDSFNRNVTTETNIKDVHQQDHDKSSVQVQDVQLDRFEDIHCLRVDKKEHENESKTFVITDTNNTKLEAFENLPEPSLSASLLDLKARKFKPGCKINYKSSSSDRLGAKNSREKAPVPDNIDLATENDVYKMSTRAVQPQQTCDFRDMYVNVLFESTDLHLSQPQPSNENLDQDKVGERTNDLIAEQIVKSASHDDLSQSSLECLLEQLVHRGKITRAFIFSPDKKVLAQSKDAALPLTDVINLYDGLMGHYNGLMKITLSDVVYTCFKCDNHTVLMGRGSNSILVAKMGSHSVTVGFAAPRTSGSCLKEITEFAGVLSGRGL